MITNEAQLIADSIATLKDEIDLATAEYKVATQSLIDLVGDEGQTFQVEDMGTVQVTRRTEDRDTNELVVSLDMDAYLKLDEKQKATLAKLNIIKVDRKKIAGQPPKVVVRLS